MIIIINDGTNDYNTHTTSNSYYYYYCYYYSYYYSYYLQAAWRLGPAASPKLLASVAARCVLGTTLTILHYIRLYYYIIYYTILYYTILYYAILY